MKSLHRCTVFFVIALAIAGCATPYYGFSKEEWNSYTEEERMAIKAEYQDIMALQEDQKRRDAHNAITQSIIDRGVNGPKYGK